MSLWPTVSHPLSPQSHASGHHPISPIPTMTALSACSRLADGGIPSPHICTAPPRCHPLAASMLPVCVSFFRQATRSYVVAPPATCRPSRHFVGHRRGTPHHRPTKPPLDKRTIPNNACLSPVLLGRAKWASIRHAKFGLAQARHGTSQWVVLGLSLQPVGRHGPAREAGRPLRHDGWHDPLVARPIKGTTHPAWNIIVVMYQVLLWSCIKYSNIMVIILCWFKNSCENKILSGFFVNALFMARRVEWARKHNGPNGPAWPE
jgi:hypothetical protein